MAPATPELNSFSSSSAVSPISEGGSVRLMSCIGFLLTLRCYAAGPNPRHERVRDRPGCGPQLRIMPQQHRLHAVLLGPAHARPDVRRGGVVGGEDTVAAQPPGRS